MIELDRNPATKSPESISVGDSVHVKTKRAELIGFDFDQKTIVCRVVEIKDSHIIGLVKTVYLYKTGTSQESQSDPLIGKTLNFDIINVHLVSKSFSIMDWIRVAAFFVFILLLARYCGEQGGENCYRPHPRATEICG